MALWGFGAKCWSGWMDGWSGVDGYPLDCYVYSEKPTNPTSYTQILIPEYFLDNVKLKYSPSLNLKDISECIYFCTNFAAFERLPYLLLYSRLQLKPLPPSPELEANSWRTLPQDSSASCLSSRWWSIRYDQRWSIMINLNLKHKRIVGELLCILLLLKMADPGWPVCAWHVRPLACI